MQENIVTKETLKHALQGAGGGGKLYRHFLSITSANLITIDTYIHCVVYSTSPNVFTEWEEVYELFGGDDASVYTYIDCYANSDGSIYRGFFIQRNRTIMSIILANPQASGSISMLNAGNVNSFDLQDYVVEA